MICYETLMDESLIVLRSQDVSFWGNVYPTLVALPYLDQTNGRVIVNTSVGNWLPFAPGMSLLQNAKAALVNFYGLTIATHGWTGSKMSRGKFMLEEGAEMQWKEERDRSKLSNTSTVEATAGGPVVEEFAKLTVAGACREDAYVKCPSCYDIFLVHRVFAPYVLSWTFRLLLLTQGARRTSLMCIGRQILQGSSRYALEVTSPRKAPFLS
ncbi:hypothetical protein SLEP1_g20779 [Rubroshorea leprosula]|uniref:CN hydrolase domain-containing protein n=1 Tax=Rubroshorea leprosula TaxID=152421 RepID=A0AAV5JCW5_9ROSI|nr:hypothetical protein SLEP1_g20779 [Rubroshorea leprosula]